MLVISRKKDESIIIDDNIVITVADIQGKSASIGIQAPLELPVFRKELCDQPHWRDTVPKRIAEKVFIARERDEAIVIGEHIIVTIIDIRGDKMRLGIQAPREARVHRQEVYEAIQRENTLKSK
jgi:carbon storage regulator